MAPSLVAVVDDEEPVRKALGRLLRASGLEAQGFASGKEFLEAMAERRPACVVLDLHMPGLSGFDVLERIGDADPPLPTIVITGHDEPDNEGRCIALGAVAFLRKPVNDVQLLQSIERVLNPGKRDGVSHSRDKT